MPDDDLFSPESRGLQERFGTTALADRLHGNIFHDRFTEDDRAFIENAPFFFLATVDAEGRPQCSYKGGRRGFVRVAGPSELIVPVYEGNGFYFSMGNVAATGNVGLLFIDFENQKRIRVNGVASLVDDHPLLAGVKATQLALRIAVTDIHPNCSRNVHKMSFEEYSRFTPPDDAQNVRAAPWGDGYDDVLPAHMKRKDD